MRKDTHEHNDAPQALHPYAVLYGCLLLFGMGWGACVLGYSTPQHDTYTRFLWLVFGCTSLFGSVYLWTLHASRLLQLPSSKQLRHITLELKETFGDLDTIRNEQRKLRKMLTEQMEDLQSRIHEEAQRLESFHLHIEQRYKLLDEKELQIRQARTQQESVQKQITSWQQMAEDYLSALERSFLYAQRTQDFACLSRVTRSFAGLCRPLGVEPLRPQPGDLFVAQEHDWAGEEHDAVIPEGDVLRCEAWGIRKPTHTKKARVVVSLGPLPQFVSTPPHADASDIFPEEDHEMLHSLDRDLYDDTDVINEILPPEYINKSEKE